MSFDVILRTSISLRDLHPIVLSFSSLREGRNVKGKLVFGRLTMFDDRVTSLAVGNLLDKCLLHGFYSQFRAGRQTLDEWSVQISQKARVQEPVHRVAQAGFFQHFNVLAHRVHRIGRNRTRSSRRRRSNTRKARVATSKKAVDGCLQIWKGKG
jgi:hypothetical protein